MPPGRPFNQFQGPRGNFGGRPPRFPQPGMMPPPGRGPAPGPGMGPGIGPGGGSPKLQSFMDTANRFLATAQGFQPLIQQATPMFRNLPALWRLYKGFQGLPKTDGPTEHGHGEPFSLEDSSEIPENFGRPDGHERADFHERPEGPVRHERHEAPVRQGMFARPSRPGRRESLEEYNISESPTYTEKVKPKKVSTRPSVPRIFQPPYYFDE
ncbi:VrrA/YqfQ family protein [Ureibacillus chungkukjangi]|nr:VrrA/YqfQ family protein [Ureibacillus chungkukjangi]